MRLLRLTATGFGLVALACGGNTTTDPTGTAAGEPTAGSAGATSETTPANTGGAVTGGANNGGTSTAGASTSGANTGGVATGGVETGGASNGGVGGTSTAGASTSGGTHGGGATTSGASGGGSDTGGSAAGGAVTSGAGPGGASVGGAATGGANTGGAPGTGGAMPECVVAVRVDDCCSEPIAVAAADLDDPCVLPYKRGYTAEQLAPCPAAEACLMVNCAHPSPPSRVAMPAGDECVFFDECSLAAEPFSRCWVATDFNYCCSCPEVVPRVVVETDPCVLTEGTPEPGTCADCSNVRCESCNTPLPTVMCDQESVADFAFCRAQPD